MTAILLPESGSTARVPGPNSRTSPELRPGRTRRGPGRALRPPARPGRAVPGPDLSRRGRPGIRACAAPVATSAPADESGAGWRLTERGIAVVLVTAAMIITAAVAVIALTALRVTGENYQSYGQSALHRP